MCKNILEHSFFLLHAAQIDVYLVDVMFGVYWYGDFINIVENRNKITTLLCYLNQNQSK